MARGTSIKQLKRVTYLNGQTLHFMIRGADRQHPPEFLSKEDVPEFEGKEAWFEMRRVRKGPWMGWEIVQQVDKPAYEA
jgi:hypothetical protein